jgi:hypothetical protein
MGIIIVFTIFCEQSLLRMKRWITYFNPLLMPCLDKVVAELMILGATAFSLVIINEIHPLGGYGWYATLHWIDTVIFVFAILYVIVVMYIFVLMGYVRERLALIDGIPVHELVEAEVSKNEHHTIADLEKEAQDFVQGIHGELKKHLARSHEGTHALPRTVCDPIIGAHTEADDTLYHPLRQQIHSFLNSEDTEIELQLATAGHHDHAKKVVHPLEVMGVLASVSDSVRVRSHGNKGVRIKIKKQPRHTWDLRKDRAVFKKQMQLARSKKGWLSDFGMSTQMRYHLIKHHFLTTFFPKYACIDSQKQFDFVNYYSVVMSFGITDCFVIGIREWFVLFVATLPVVKDIGGVKDFQVFTCACAILLAVSTLATRWLMLVFSRILHSNYDTKQDLASLSKTMLDVVKKHTPRPPPPPPLPQVDEDVDDACADCNGTRKDSYWTADHEGNGRQKTTVGFTHHVHLQNCHLCGEHQEKANQASLHTVDSATGAELSIT